MCGVTIGSTTILFIKSGADRFTSTGFRRNALVFFRRRSKKVWKSFDDNKPWLLWEIKDQISNQEAENWNFGLGTAAATKKRILRKPKEGCKKIASKRGWFALLQI